MQIKIVIPCFNDWESLGLLVSRIDQVCSDELKKQLSFLIVNDCSTAPLVVHDSFRKYPFSILQLNRNLGHQRAIAIGLSYIYLEAPCDHIIIMDSDGEDRPEDIPSLVKAYEQRDEKIVFAHRSKRHEGITFRFFYAIYKMVFRLFTGKSIGFGNFCFIPFPLLKNIVYVTEIWNHFSGGVIRSRVPYKSIPLERGRRLAGESKMNFTSLIIHGMSAVSVHIDTVAVRLLLFSVSLITMALAGIVTVSGIRLFTPLAIPGWASFLVAAFAIIIFQAFLISLFLVFVVLTYRTQRNFIPAIDYKNYMEGVEKIN